MGDNRQHKGMREAIKAPIAGTIHDRRLRLTKEQKQSIKKLYATGKYSYAKLARIYGVSPSTIQITIHPILPRRQLLP